MAEAQESGSPSHSTISSGGGGNKLVMILTLVNLLVSLALGAVLFISFKKEKSQQSIADIQASPEGGEESASDEKDSKDGHGGEHGGKKGEKNEKKKADLHMVNLDQFTVNLAIPGGTQMKFVRVNMSIEVTNEEMEKEIQEKMAQVRNSVLDIFNGKKPTDLQTSEQRDYLKEEIKNALNSFLNSGKVKGVYFTNFAVSG